MQFDNEMTVSMTGISQNESFARTVTASFISQLDPSVGELTDIKTAVSEAVTNAIIHGYYKKKGIVTLMCGVNGRDVYIEVRDDGHGIADINEARMPLYTSKPEMERSGLGFTVMESFMDAVYVESEPGRGTKVVMKKKLS